MNAEEAEKYRQAMERAKYVDPVRSNSCNSLLEANNAIKTIMKTVDHVLMCKKVDSLVMPAGKHTTVMTAQMVACQSVSAPDGKVDD